VSRIVLAWWLLFVGRNFLGWWIFHLRHTGRSPLDALIATTYRMLVDELLTIPAACAAIALVVLIERRQDAFAEALQHEGTGRGEGAPAEVGRVSP
jgi:hypothetical protein